MVSETLCDLAPACLWLALFPVALDCSLGLHALSHGCIIQLSFGNFSQCPRFKLNKSESFAFVDKNFSWFSIFSKQPFEFVLRNISRQIPNKQPTTLSVSFFSRSPQERQVGFKPLRVGDLLFAAAAGPAGRGPLMMLLVVGWVMLPASAGLPASSVRRLWMAARSA